MLDVLVYASLIKLLVLYSSLGGYSLYSHSERSEIGTTRA